MMEGNIEIRLLISGTYCQHFNISTSDISLYILTT